MQETLGEILSQDAPPVTAVDAVAIARDHFGIAATARPLAGERDHNFHIQSQERGDFVLKLSHPAEDAGFTSFQTAALDHISHVDPTLPVPRVQSDLWGDSQPLIPVGGNAPRLTRLMTYLPGTLLYQTPATPVQDRNLGVFLARLGRALRGFFDPAAGSDLLWDIRKVGQTRPMMAHVTDDARRAVVERAIDDFEAFAAPVIPSLRAQIVHNDMNPYNVVMSGDAPDRVCGILDFGDMIHSPLICDVAIGAMYRWPVSGHPLEAAGRFVAGYHSVQPLEDEELRILLNLIRARLALTTNIATWQAEQFPAKRDYVLRLSAEIQSSLQRLDGLSRDDAHRYFLDATTRE